VGRERDPHTVRPPADAELIELPDRPLIAAIEAEQSVLGGLLLDNTAWDRIADLVGEHDFYRADHRLIFQHIGALIEHGKPADTLTVAESLERSGKLGEIGGQAYLAALSLNTPSAANIRRYAEIVHERSERRTLQALGAELHDAAGKPGTEVEALRQRAQERLGAIQTRDGLPSPLNMAELASRDPQPPLWIVQDWLPAGYATLFAGHGGAGKSSIALHLSVCIAMGGRWAGKDCTPCRVLYLSAEDRADLIHLRLARIGDHLGIGLAELSGRLDVLDLVGQNCVLWERDPRTGATATPAYALLAARIRSRSIDLLVVDSVSDFFGGGENVRGEVKRFINSLLALVPQDRGALLLLHHVDKAIARGAAPSGEGYSGSTGWHNSVRARWYLYPELEEPAEGGDSERTGRLILAAQKQNLGRAEQRIAWRWDDEQRLFVAEAAPSEFDRRHQDREELAAIRRSLKGCLDCGLTVPAAMQGPRTAYLVLSQRPEFPDSLRGGSRPKTARFRRHVEALRQMLHVEETSIRRENRHAATVIVLTTRGRVECA
jgi:RecA-family ATPase